MQCHIIDWCGISWHGHVTHSLQQDAAAGLWGGDVAVPRRLLFEDCAVKMAQSAPDAVLQAAISRVVGDVHQKQRAAEEQAEFIASAVFSGAKPGYYFSSGDKGVGCVPCLFYIDNTSQERKFPGTPASSWSISCPRQRALLPLVQVLC